jgi:twitching motility protein PilT
MIDHLNSTGGYNIITIEDPIEYIHTGKMSTITQRQLGNHTNSFPEALKHALRQNPDVVLVGEVRDTATAAAVINLAESGNLVLTTSHAPSAPHAIERIVDMFPPEDREFVQTRLASLLVAVLCQTLVPRANKAGRIAAAEIMVVDDSIRSLIRDGKFFQLPNAMLGHHDIGMTSMEDSLKDLLSRGMIDKDVHDKFCKTCKLYKEYWK